MLYMYIKSLHKHIVMPEESDVLICVFMHLTLEKLPPTLEKLPPNLTKGHIAFGLFVSLSDCENMRLYYTFLFSKF